MFGPALEECRAALRAAQSQRSALTLDPREDLSEPVAAAYRLLLAHGQVVWGVFAQVNKGLLVAGRQDLPGNTVYSLDPSFDAAPGELRDIGQALYQLKDAIPDDPQLELISATISNEHNNALQLLLPDRLTGGREVLFSWTFGHRRRLPDGVLSDRVVPLVVAPEHTPVNMILPARFWAEPLTRAWGRLTRKLPPPRPLFTAEETECWQPRPYGHPWLKRGPGPLTVTDAARRALLEWAASERQAGVTWYLRVSLTPEGEQWLGIATDWDPQQEARVESNGVQILLDHRLADDLDGCVIDYLESMFQSGLVIHPAH